MSENTREMILDILKPMQSVMLATCTNNQPYVRPMILIYENEQFFFATGTADTKAQQIELNPLVEICLIFDNDQGRGYVRATGYLITITDAAVKKEIHDVAKFIQNYFPEPTDEGFALYQMIWQKVEFMQAGQSKTVSLDW